MLEHQQPHDLNTIRNSILDRSPILTEFMDSVDMSVEYLDKARNTVYRDIVRSYGKRSRQEMTEGAINAAIDHVANIFTVHGFVDQEAEKKDKYIEGLHFAVYETLVYIGYEIGNTQDASYFFSDITSLLICLDTETDGELFSDTARHNLENGTGREDLTQKIVPLALQTGITLRERFTNKHISPAVNQPTDGNPVENALNDGPQAQKTDIPTVMQAFIDTLDLADFRGPDNPLDDRRR